MKRISQGSIRKRQKRNGKWEWQALLVITDGGKKRQVTKYTGVACSALAESERGSGRRPLASGKGAARATEFLRSWREEVVAAEGGETRTASGAATLQLGDFMEAYWETLSVKKSTMKGYHNLKKHIMKLPGRACDVEPADVQQWMVTEQRDGVGAATLKKSYVAMKSAFEWAVGLRLLDRNPCAPVKPPKPVKRDPNPLDDANIAKLAAALSGLDESGERQLADAIRLALFTGMRQGELCGLRWRDVDGALAGKMAVGGQMHVDNTIEIVEGGC